LNKVKDIYIRTISQPHQRETEREREREREKFDLHVIKNLSLKSIKIIAHAQ